MTTTTSPQPVIVPRIGDAVCVDPSGGPDREDDRFRYSAVVVARHPAAGEVAACIDLQVLALIDEHGDVMTSGCPFEWSLYDSEQAAGTWRLIKCGF